MPNMLGLLRARARNEGLNVETRIMDGRALQSARPDFQGLPVDPPPLPLQLQDPERLRKQLAGD